MPNRLAFAGAVFIAIATLLGPQRAAAEGNLVLCRKNGAVTWLRLSSGKPASRLQ